ncbi:NAD(P)-dependent dehydrogenase, short-chain alcohol dehydrogenase family [Geosmithia morbida]|uniref:NAD(P)-dependent dehydrogenase, short-chain alcohol dehydrogenase family n=1 Tax=Geosmithia morbida TaxID=1094350 RepID=A0A9P4YSD5_9HYPO|nr:NAD(P)-dependent dehydrogenase, short-chain alcohol dehydrogenase family [Geosmithia morbida]KAF4120119.1 NAD(P)-dependent dehydrogenase, short-chain alcohol dehydrogenase family [Geosmithia morbida]
MAYSLLRGSAFITGAAGGIGQSTAFAFARNGITKLALTDINGYSLQKTRKLIKSEFPNVQVLANTMDVRDKKQIVDTIDYIVSHFGRLDIAVNNAGIGGSGKPTHETPDDEIENVLAVNLMGVYKCQKEELRTMLNQDDLGPRHGRGRIINVASMYGIVAPGPSVFYTAYSTAKHAVIGLTKSDASSYGKHQIRINAICPGFVETPLMEKASSGGDSNDVLQKTVDSTPIGRICMQEEISESIVSIASSMNSFMQGSAVVVDGGFTAY